MFWGWLLKKRDKAPSSTRRIPAQKANASSHLPQRRMESGRVFVREFRLSLVGLGCVTMGVSGFMGGCRKKLCKTRGEVRRGFRSMALRSMGSRASRASASPAVGNMLKPIMKLLYGFSAR